MWYVVFIPLDKMSSGNLISFDTLLQRSFNPQTRKLFQTNLTSEKIKVLQVDRIGISLVNESIIKDIKERHLFNF